MCRSVVECLRTYTSMQPPLSYERALWQQGITRVAGVDEVGRGAWAGPIVAAAVSLTAVQARRLSRAAWWRRVADSKLLPARAREEIYAAATVEVLYAVAALAARQIDAAGIGAANRSVVELALARLKPKPSFAFIDYVPRLAPKLARVPVRVVVDGDARVFVVALASVIAKVTRDRLMERFDAAHPGYGFARHKGYGTAEHRRALVRLGPCALHRKSFRPVSLFSGART